MTIHTQVINLDGSDSRLRAAEAECSAAGIPFNRLPAFDGRGKAPETLPLYDRSRAVRVFGRALTGGEIGCFLSHLEAARRFLETDALHGLVMEDDFRAVPRAGELLTRLSMRLTRNAARTDWHLVNVGAAAHRIFTPLEEIGPGHVLVRAHYFPVTTTALLWSRAGAAAFLQEARAIDMPVDHWLRLWATRQRTGLAVNAALLPARKDLASDIDTAAHRRQASRKAGAYFVAKQTRLWRNKINAWRAKRSFEAG